MTAVILVSGITSFSKGDPARSQRMMRARVAMQGATLVALAYYSFNRI